MRRGPFRDLNFRWEDIEVGGENEESKEWAGTSLWDVVLMIVHRCIYLGGNKRGDQTLNSKCPSYNGSLFAHPSSKNVTETTTYYFILYQTSSRVQSINHRLAEIPSRQHEQTIPAFLIPVTTYKQHRSTLTVKTRTDQQPNPTINKYDIIEQNRIQATPRLETSPSSILTSPCPCPCP